MSGRIVTAAEALALLDAREAKGAWRAGTVEAEGKVWARDPDALGGPSVGEVCVFNANTYRPHNGNRALAAAAPDLAATVVAQAAEIARLRAALNDLAPRCDFADCDDIATHWCPTARRVEHACAAHAADDSLWTEDDHADALRSVAGSTS